MRNILSNDKEPLRRTFRKYAGYVQQTSRTMVFDNEGKLKTIPLPPATADGPMDMIFDTHIYYIHFNFQSANPPNSQWMAPIDSKGSSEYCKTGNI